MAKKNPKRSNKPKKSRTGKFPQLSQCLENVSRQKEKN